MNNIIKDLINNKGENYILPFLWMRGEEEKVIREEIEKIYECGIRAICVESRPHPDFAGPGWWHDLDIVMEEAKQRGMRVWVLDDSHFPTGYANGLITKKYPNRKKTYINYNTVDVLGAQNEVTLYLSQMLKPKSSWLDIGKPGASTLIWTEKLRSRTLDLKQMRRTHYEKTRTPYFHARV